MASENISVQPNTDISCPRPAPRSDLRLTAKERKFMLLGVDLILVNCMLLASVMLWNDFMLSWEYFASYIKWFLTLSVLWLIVGTVLDVYNLVRASRISTILLNISIAAILSTLIYIAIPWLSPPIVRRSYILGLVLLMTGALIVWRVFYARVMVQTAFSQRGLIVGNGVPALALSQVVCRTDEDTNVNTSLSRGYEVVGRIVDGAPAIVDDSIPLLGDVRRLVRLARQYTVDEIILAPEDDRELSLEALEVLLDCRELGLRVSSLASVYERLTGRLPVDYARYDLDLLLSPTDSPAIRLYVAAKRALDILLAVIGLSCLGVLLPFVALGNALTSPGPLFYRQERMGKGGRPFTIVKLRSMSLDAERSSGAVWSGDDDPRITPMGRLLRKSRLDEVPQLINVLRGEMSMVGPRPERPHFVGQLARTFPLYRARHAVKPGITGWAQVNYEYGNSVEDSRVKLEYDLYYVKHASFYLDLLILLHTVRIIIGLKGQ